MLDSLASGEAILTIVCNVILIVFQIYTESELKAKIEIG